MRTLLPVLGTTLAALVLQGFGCSRQPASQEPPAPVAPSPPAVAPAATTARPSSTKSIQCGEQVCVAGETVCVRPKGKAPACVAPAAADESARGGSDEDLVLKCDDDSDCGQGQHCCAGQYWGGTGPHMHVCDDKPCDQAIACVVGSDCPQGLACRPTRDGYGHCEPANPGVQCGGSRCEGATPVCCWNAQTKQGKCIAEPADGTTCTDDGEERLRCRGKSDCGGYTCCLQMMNGTGCWSTCPGPSLGVACETMADCPAEGPGPGGMRQRYDACEDGACTGKMCNPSGNWVPCDSL